MFYYGNTSSNNDHYDNNNKSMQSHHHHNNQDNNNFIESGSFAAGDSFPLYLQQQGQEQHNLSSASAQNIPIQQPHHSSTTNDNSLFFGYNNDATTTTSQAFDSSFLNDPLLTLAGQEYDMQRGLGDSQQFQKQHDGFETHKDFSAYMGTSWSQPHNNNHHHHEEDDMMLFSQNQLQQFQQQQQLQEQTQHQNLSVTPDNRHHPHHHHEAENAILNAFSGIGQEDAILLSDPNFVRQQQLLHEQQQRMMHMQEEEEDTGTIGGMIDGTSGDATESMMRSNLSAMFDETSSDDKADRDPNVTSSLQVPSLDSSFAVAADRPTRHSYSPSTPAPEIKQELEQQYQQSQQQQLLQQQQSWEQAMFSKKQLQQKRINNNARASKRTSSPIPIKGMDLSCNDRPVSSSVPSEIDHQRRQNELQARFRITYARKPQQQQQQQQQMQKAGRSSATIATPSSFSGSSAAHVQPSSTLGTSVPNMPSSDMKDFDTDLVMSSPQIALTPDPSLPGSSLRQNQDNTKGLSTSPSTSSTGGGERGGNNSTSGQNMRAASKSPSVQHQAINFPSRTMPIQIQRVQRATVPLPIDAEQHQRKLDDQLEKVDFDDITVSELKDMLRQRGKPATGKKAILVQRLQDERDFIRAVKSGKAQRHSQPPLSSSTGKLNESGRPRSYQGSSPLTPHASVASPLPQSPLLAGSPSSMPNSFIPPGSPSSVTYSLNRSIANMHIGSPPQHPRRYSPYVTPGSPRMSSASPKLQPQKQQANYSSSVPTNALSSSPNSLTYGSPLSSSFTGRTRPINAYTPTTNARSKTYAPFASSALATPDRDDDRDPFDDLNMEDQEYIKTEQQENGYNIKQENSMDYPTSSSLPVSEPIKMEGMDTSGATSTTFLKNANLPEGAYDYISEGFTREDLLAVLAGQGFGDPTMGLQTTATEGYISNDAGSSSANMMLFDHLDNLSRYQHEGQQENGPK